MQECKFLAHLGGFCVARDAEIALFETLGAMGI